MISVEERPEIESVLTAMVDEAIAAVRLSLAKHPMSPFPPYGVTISATEDGGRALGPFTFLDITKRNEVLRKVMEESQAEAYMFMWQGFMDIEVAALPMRIRAMLFVTATQWGALAGRALPYDASPLGVNFYNEMVVPETVVAEYGKLFSPKVVM